MNFGLKMYQYLYIIDISTIVYKKYGKNCGSYEKAVTASETSMEYTMRRFTTVAYNNCRL